MKKYLPIILLLILGISCRFLPHPANFAPISAIAIFGAMYLPKKWALILPLSAMFISDIFLGFYSPLIMIAVYTSFLLIVLIGLKIKENKKLHTVLAGTITGSIIFFLTTNMAVWAFGTMYTKNLSGLINSYYMALPFFRNSLLGDLFYVGILVGGMELVILLQNKKVLSEIKA